MPTEIDSRGPPGQRKPRPTRKGQGLRQRSNQPSSKRRQAEKFGEQAALCRRLMCAAAFARHWLDMYPDRPIDWTQLRELSDLEQRSHPHHEPPGSNDERTIPLSWAKHTGGFMARHTVGRRRFYEWAGFNPEDVIKELQRRLARESG